MAAEKKVIFTAGTGRAGTTSITRIFNTNVRGCVAEHEPPPIKWDRLSRIVNRLRGRRNYRFHDKGFGDALRWYDMDDPKLEAVIKGKARRIRNLDCNVYLEANHSFLKSTCDGLVGEFPELKVIHLTRDPLEVAKSFTNRVNRTETPSFAGFAEWNPLPAYRKNCLPLRDVQLSTFQRYIWMWIEIELRFVRFVSRYPHVTYVELDTQQLSDEGAVEDMFRVFELEKRSASLALPTPQNKNRVSTEVTPEDLREAKALLQKLPIEAIRRLRSPYDLLGIRDA